jgi:transposase
MDTITYVGLDVHKATVSVALAESGRGDEIRQVGVFENRPEVFATLAPRLNKLGHRLSFCYEAAPCGYGLHRTDADLIPDTAYEAIRDLIRPQAMRN